MLYTCPHCGATIERSFAFRRTILESGTCGSCGKKYRIIPVAVKADDPAAKAREKEYNSDMMPLLIICILIALGLAAKTWFRLF